MDKYSKVGWLVTTLMQGMRCRYGLTLKEIQEKAEERFGKPLHDRTFRRWCTAANDLLGVSIVNDPNRGYVYYIENIEEVRSNKVTMWLLDNVSTNNLLLSYRAIQEQILLPVIPAGKDLLPQILEAIRRRTVMRVTYQSFKNDKPNTYDLAPYCVKLFKQRWYVAGQDPNLGPDSTVWPYSLDRIISITPVSPERHFVIPETFNPTEYFSDCYGIFDAGGKPQTVVLKATPNLAHYLRSLPLHHSQRETERNSEYSLFELFISPTSIDFQIELLSHTPEIEVLEPAELRKSIMEKVERLYRIYKAKSRRASARSRAGGRNGCATPADTGCSPDCPRS